MHKQKQLIRIKKKNKHNNNNHNNEEQQIERKKEAQKITNLQFISA